VLAISPLTFIGALKPQKAGTHEHSNPPSCFADALYPTKAYDLPAVCERYGLEPGEDDEAFSSKRQYVRRRLQKLSDQQVFDIAQRIVSGLSGRRTADEPSTVGDQDPKRRCLLPGNPHRRARASTEPCHLNELQQIDGIAIEIADSSYTTHH